MEKKKKSTPSGKPPVELARFNCLLPAELHKRVKVGCASEGINMTDVVVEFLERRFPAQKHTK